MKAPQPRSSRVARPTWYSLAFFRRRPKYVHSVCGLTTNEYWKPARIISHIVWQTSGVGRMGSGGRQLAALTKASPRSIGSSCGLAIACYGGVRVSAQDEKESRIKLGSTSGFINQPQRPEKGTGSLAPTTVQKTPDFLFYSTADSSQTINRTPVYDIDTEVYLMLHQHTRMPVFPSNAGA